MDTDEYEISLLREVANCTGYILSLQSTLRQLEKKYHLTTDDIVNENSHASAPVDDRDRALWLDAYRALASWKKRRSEYEALHGQMKK